MTRRIVPGVLGLLFLSLSLSAVRGADDSYTIKLRPPKPGETTWHERTAAIDMLLKVLDASGAELVDRREKGTATTTFWQQVQTVPQGGPPSKLRRGYGSARIKVDDEIKPLPFEGAQVQFEEIKAGKFRFTSSKGGELKGKDALVLTNEFNNGGLLTTEDFLPGRPVKVGESWNIKAERFAVYDENDIVFKMDVANAKATAQLTKVYMKDGVQFGIIVARWEVPVVSLSTPKRSFKFEKGSTFICHITADAPIDGSSPFGTFKRISYMKASDMLEAMGQKFKLSVTVRHDEEEIIKAPPKK